MACGGCGRKYPGPTNNQPNITPQSRRYRIPIVRSQPPKPPSTVPVPSAGTPPAGGTTLPT